MVLAIVTIVRKREVESTIPRCRNSQQILHPKVFNPAHRSEGSRISASCHRSFSEGAEGQAVDAQFKGAWVEIFAEPPQRKGFFACFALLLLLQLLTATTTHYISLGIAVRPSTVGPALKEILGNDEQLQRADPKQGNDEARPLLLRLLLHAAVTATIMATTTTTSMTTASPHKHQNARQPHYHSHDCYLS